MSYHTLKSRSDIFNIIKSQSVIAEIGVFKGDFSKIIYNIAKPRELHLVDIFDGITISGDKDGQNIISANLADEYENIKKYFDSYQNVFLHKGKSVDVLSSFPDQYFDLLYIDGDHSYNGVSKDLEIAMTKIKHKGFISGHDYNQQAFPGVYDAVNHFCAKYNLSIKYLTEDLLPSFVIINE